MAWCSTCWFLDETLTREGAASTAELLHQRDVILARVADLLRRTGVEDAPRLIRKLEQL